MPRLPSIILFVAALMVVGCAEEPQPGPPDGWETDEDARWWQAGVDTTVALRDLSGFDTMGLSDREDGLREEGPIIRNIQRQFLALYRNHPEVVDSVFASVAIPMIERAGFHDRDSEERDELVRQINRRIHREFYPAQPRRDQEPIVRPDSLREAGVAGIISMQIYLDEQGDPLAIKRLEGIHPTMDAIVMGNYARRDWQPAHLRGSPIPSWITVRVTLAE